MKESQFIEKNEADWKKLELLLLESSKDADKLHILFEKVSGDLAYARTFYPNRSVRLYLNNLTQKVLNSIGQKKNKFDISSIVKYYNYTLPYQVYQSRNAFFVSFGVFMLSIIIGIISTANLPDFANLILGDEYIRITEENIRNGDPAGIYSSSGQSEMMLGITINNIRVSFLTFVLGLLGSVGTIYILISNGIMVGTFLYFFQTKNVFWEAFPSIMIHGTIELSSIIIAGGAGIILGNGLLFPGSYDRHTSLLLSAKRAVSIILGLVPLFIIAGFLESFVTRYTGMPLFLKWSIIGLSSALILYLFVYSPWRISRSSYLKTKGFIYQPVATKQLSTNKYVHRSIIETLSISVAEFRLNFGVIISHIILPTTIFLGVVIYFVLKVKMISDEPLPFDLFNQKFTIGNWALYLSSFFVCVYTLLVLIMVSKKESLSTYNKLVHTKMHFFQLLLPAIALTCIFFIVNMPWLIILLLFIPPHFIFIICEEITNDSPNIFKSTLEYYKISFQQWLNFLVFSFIIFLFYYALNMTVTTLLADFIVTFIGWHDLLGDANANRIFTMYLLKSIAVFICIPFIFYLYTYCYASLKCLKNSKDLFEKFKTFGEGSNIFETKA